MTIRIRHSNSFGTKDNRSLNAMSILHGFTQWVNALEPIVDPGDLITIKLERTPLTRSRRA